MLYPTLTEAGYKIAQWVAPKTSWFSVITSNALVWKKSQPLQGKVIWMHCASLGEFEMGKSAFELYLERHPDWKGVVTFFSPSGYEPKKTYSRAQVFYLPFDSPKEVKRWLTFLKPSLAVFVRYDLWPNHIRGLYNSNVPIAVIGMSASRTPWYLSRGLPMMRSLFKKAISLWGVNSEQDSAVLSFAGLHSSVLGNPKYDYAVQLMDQPASPLMRTWRSLQVKPVLLLGSAHLSDVEFVLKSTSLSNYTLWIVAHDLQHVPAMASLLDENGLRIAYSTQHEPQVCEVFMIDEMGILPTLYALADAVFIGGGFGKATHNVLESVAQGKTAASGPNWQKIAENSALVQQEFLVPCSTSGELNAFLNQAQEDGFATNEKALKWLRAQSGSSLKIVEALEQTI